MTRVTAESDGRANDRMKHYYERYAKGGFAAIISEGIYTDQKHSQGYDNQPGLATKEHVEAWKPIVETVHEHGTKMIAQLMHAGAIRGVVGSKFVVGIRLSQGKVSDQAYKWPGGEETAETIFTTIGELPIDYIHVTDGDGTAESFGEGSRSMAKAAKDFGGKPVIANGKLGDPDQALKAVEEEGADFVSLGTGALANPDTPHRVQKGLELKEFDAESILFPIAHVKDMELNMDIK